MGNAIVIVPRERFHWLTGEDHRVTYTLRPTYTITRCKTCGRRCRPRKTSTMFF